MPHTLDLAEEDTAPQHLDGDILSECDCTVAGRGNFCSIDHWSDAD